MVDYKKYIGRRSILFGTFSANKAARRIIKDLQVYNIARYGSTLYEQAYNYYQVAYRRNIKDYVIPIVVCVISLVLCYLSSYFIALSTILTCLIVGYLRKGY